MVPRAYPVAVSASAASGKVSLLTLTTARSLGQASWVSPASTANRYSPPDRRRTSVFAMSAGVIPSRAAASSRLRAGGRGLASTASPRCSGAPLRPGAGRAAPDVHREPALQRRRQHPLNTLGPRPLLISHEAIVPISAA